MPEITLPPGCRRLTFADGSDPVTADRWGHATVTDSQAKMIDSMRGNGEGGLIHGQTGIYTKSRRSAGRWCMTCVPPRLWNAWNKRCPRCDAETVPE